MYFDFSYCPLSCILHVTLANGQGFGFEFHLSSSPSAFSGFVNVSQPADYFTTCYTVLMRPNKVETAVLGCNLWLSVWTLSYCCPVKVSIGQQGFYSYGSFILCKKVF